MPADTTKAVDELAVPMPCRRQWSREASFVYADDVCCSIAVNCNKLSPSLIITGHGIFLKRVMSLFFLDGRHIKHTRSVYSLVCFFVAATGRLLLPVYYYEQHIFYCRTPPI